MTARTVMVGGYSKGDFKTERRKAAAGIRPDAVDAAGIEATAHVHSSKVYDAMIAEAPHLQTDLILIGAHQPEVRDYFLGLNAARVVRHSGATVLAPRD